MQAVESWMKAANIDRWTEVLLKALSPRVRKRWRFVSFRGTDAGEWSGIVDVLAIRKNTARLGDPMLRRGDLFEMILIQIQGGSAKKPTHKDVRRLMTVAQRYDAKAVVLFERRQEASYSFSRLNEQGQWVTATAESIFGVL